MRKTLSKIYQPTGQKSSSLRRNGLDNFFIELHEPHRQFAPGDLVRGNVVLVLQRKQRVQTIQATLKGTIIIRNPLIKGKTAKYTLFDDEIVLYNDDSELPPGEHNFAFEFSLPTEGIYTSVEFERGSISYVLAAKGHKPGATPVLMSQKVVSVISPIDVALLSPPKPSCLSVEVRKKRQSRGSINCTLELTNRGYLRGEAVPIKVSIKHIKSVKSLTGVVLTLSRISRVTADGLEPQTFRKDIAQTVSPLYTDPVTLSASVSTSIRIPADTFPTTKGHKVVSFQYCIEAVIDLTGNSSPLSSSSHEPLNGFVDTDKLRTKQGVVHLWSDLVVGTERSSPSQRRQRGCSSSTTNTSDRSSTMLPPQSQLSNTHNMTLSLNSDSIASLEAENDSNTPPPVQIPSYQETSEAVNSSTDEKTRLQRMEEALLPSEPPDVESYSSIPEPSAPMNSSMQESATAPSYDTQENSNLNTNGQQQQDKLEVERDHLAQLASVPPGENNNNTSEDYYVPSYEPHAPPAFDYQDTFATNNTMTMNNNSAHNSDNNNNLYSTGMPSSSGPSAPPSSSSHRHEEPSAPPLPENTSYMPYANGRRLPGDNAFREASPTAQDVENERIWLDEIKNYEPAHDKHDDNNNTNTNDQ